MNYLALIGLIAGLSAISSAALAAAAESVPAINDSGNVTDQKLDASLVTNSWNLSTLYKDKEVAVAEYQRLDLACRQINLSFRHRFDNLTGPVLLDYIEKDPSA
jgi:oligoendopeptidase F